MLLCEHRVFNLLGKYQGNAIARLYGKFCKKLQEFAFQRGCFSFTLLSITIRNSLVSLNPFSRVTRLREGRPVSSPFLHASDSFAEPNPLPQLKGWEQRIFSSHKKTDHFRQGVMLKSSEITKSPCFGQMEWHHCPGRSAYALWFKILGLGLARWTRENCCSFDGWSCRVLCLWSPHETDAIRMGTPRSCLHYIPLF